MHRGSILTKTGKGLMEATGKTSNLSRELRNVLKEIDGQVSVSKLLDRLEKLSEPKLLDILKQLEIENYVREFVASEDPRSSTGRPSISQPPADADDLDFTSPVPRALLQVELPGTSAERGRKLQAQEIARQVQARRAHEEAAARARAEAEALHRKVAEARARKGAEEKARQEIANRAKVDTAASVSALDRARQEAEERVRRAEEEKARLEAEARARVELELGIKREDDGRSGKENAERAQRESAERARREAEESARREREERARAEQAARLEAEARARLEAEVRVRREQEERARREADQRARQEEMIRRRAAEEAAKRRQTEEDRALERSLREQEEKARQETEREREEAERQQREERGRRQADRIAVQEETEKRAKELERQARDEEKARAKAKAKAEAEAEQEVKPERSKEKAGVDAWRGDETAVPSRGAEPVPAREAWARRRPPSMARQLPALLIVVLIVAIAAIPFISLEKAPFEKAAQTWLGQPVKIGGVSWSLFPTPQLKFEKVAIGKDAQMRVGVVRATPEVLSLLSERKVLRALDLENASFPREFLPVLLIVRGGNRSLGVERITAKGLKLDMPELKLAAVDVDAAFAADGSLKTVTLLNAERKLSVKLEPQRGRAAVEISSGSFPLPIGLDQTLTDFAAKGTLTRNELALSEVEVRGFGGRLLGSMRLRWSDGWAVDGAFTARQLEVAKLAAPLFAAGSLDGKAAYSMRATAPERLLAGARLEGNFIIQKGSIANIDMTRLLQSSGSSGGTTSFTDMSGAVIADSSRVSVRQIRLAAGLMNGAGQVDMDSQSRLSGRLQLELRSAGARATLGVGGTLEKPQYRRN
jgi:hypothetical protein